MPRAEEGLDAIIRRIEDGGHRRRHEHVRDEHAEVRESLARGHPDGHGVGRRGRFESNGKEHDLLVGIGGRNGDGVERRVHHPHIAAMRFQLQEISLRARHPQHVAERAEDHLRA